MTATARLTIGLAERHRAAAARLYLDAFGAKLGPILGRGARAERFLVRVLRPDHAVAAEDETGALIGVAGFQDDAGGFVGGDFSDLRREYGMIGAAWRLAALALFERAPAEGQLLMDGIVVGAGARGRGVGGAMLARLRDLAVQKSCRELRLDVVDTNPRARALYERNGFRPVRDSGSTLLKPVFGFSRSTTMVLAI